MGTIKYEIFITHQLIVSKKSPNFWIEQFLNEEKQFMLNVLPKGTKFFHIQESAFDNSLMHKFTLTFKHTLFEDGSRVEKDEFREAYMQNYLGNEGPSLHQLNLFLGLKYFNPDGTQKYV